MDVQRLLELIGLVALIGAAGWCFVVAGVHLVPERGRRGTGRPHRAAHAPRRS